MNFEAIFIFFNDSSLITYIVLVWLSLYFIISFSILFAKISHLTSWKSREKQKLEALLLGERDLSRIDPMLEKYADSDFSYLEIYKNLVSRRASSGLTWLSIIASTSPFIGLFGTIISILETFSGLGSQNSLSIIAPKISEALVATGCGILVAIPAYTFHLIIKRKVFELLSIIDSEIKILNSNK